MIGLALAVLAPLAAWAHQATGGTLVPKAVSFVRTLARGDFTAAEADFSDPMKQAAPPAKLGEIWQALISQFGSFQDTGDTKTLIRGGFTAVVVRTDFKSRALGIAVTFDSAGRIAGMHLDPPP